MKFTTPELVTTRTRVLDYFAGQKQLIKDDHLIFRFERTMEVGGIGKLLEQVCWEIGMCIFVILCMDAIYVRIYCFGDDFLVQVSRRVTLPSMLLVRRKK